MEKLFYFGWEWKQPSSFKTLQINHSAQWNSKMQQWERIKKLVLRRWKLNFKLYYSNTSIDFSSQSWISEHRCEPSTPIYLWIYFSSGKQCSSLHVFFSFNWLQSSSILVPINPVLKNMHFPIVAESLSSFLSSSTTEWANKQHFLLTFSLKSTSVA